MKEHTVIAIDLLDVTSQESKYEVLNTNVQPAGTNIFRQYITTVEVWAEMNRCSYNRLKCNHYLYV